MSNDFISKINQIHTFMPSLLKHMSSIVMVEGLNFIHDNFDAGGFITGNGINKWQDRKIPKNVWRKKGVTGKKSSRLTATKTGKKHLKDITNKRALLVKKGKLRRSWDHNSKAYNMRVEFISPLAYAKVHNDGGRAGRGAGFTMPKRQMIGQSPELDKRIKRKLDKLMNNILK